MNVARREIEGIEVLDLEGRLTAGAESGALREEVTTLVHEGKNSIVLNLKQVDSIDSSGLGTVVVCFAALQHQGGALKLANLAPRHKELLALTKLTTVLESFDDERDAVNSFFPDRTRKRSAVREQVLEYARTLGAA